MPYDAQLRSSTGAGGPSGAGTGRFSNTTERPQMDHPSTKYREIEMPNPVTMGRASSPPRPTLPRRSEPRSWKATTRERYPLTSSLTGPGRAGKQGTLLGASGGRYEGEVLAGRPHGRGQYFVQKDSRSKDLILQYDGDWIQGRREGNGTRYYPTGEVYSGDWVANLRHGTGRYEYSNGDMYVGQWLDDKRTGAGTMYMASGDIFMGNFTSDRREGMGTLYLMSRQKKYVAEYVKDSPKCGTVLEIDDDDLAPLKGHLASMAAARKLDAAAAGEAISRLPPLQLLQPSKVLAEQVVDVRKERQAGGKVLKAVQAASGNLSERDIEMLRHSFTLMAAGDGPEVGLLPHQLRELVVMAGLDPAAQATRSLVEELVKRKAVTTNRISFDSFMLVVTHFQDDAVAAAAEAAAYTAAAQTTATLAATTGARGVVPNTGLAHLLAGAAAAAADAAAAEAAEAEAAAAYAEEEAEAAAAYAEEEAEAAAAYAEEEAEAGGYEDYPEEVAAVAEAVAGQLPVASEGDEEQFLAAEGEEEGGEGQAEGEEGAGGAE